MDDVLLPGRVAGGHGFSRRHGDALGHADELLGRGRLVGGVPGLKQLGDKEEGVTGQDAFV